MYLSTCLSTREQTLQRQPPQTLNLVFNLYPRSETYINASNAEAEPKF